jgi:hypothetical protein
MPGKASEDQTGELSADGDSAQRSGPWLSGTSRACGCRSVNDGARLIVPRRVAPDTDPSSN